MASASWTTFDLGHAEALPPARARTLELDVPVDALVRRPDLHAPAGDADAAPRRLRTTATGYALRLRFDVGLDGPVHALPRGRRRAASRSTPARSTSPAAATRTALAVRRGGRLDLRAWARDALALALPDPDPLRRGLPRPLRRSAAQNLNEDPDHEHEREPDPRWAKLSELEARLSQLCTLPRAHGRPQATTVPLAHQQAPLAAQDLAAEPARPARSAARRACRTACVATCGTYAGREVVVQAPDRRRVAPRP